MPYDLTANDRGVLRLPSLQSGDGLLLLALRPLMQREEVSFA